MIEVRRNKAKWFASDEERRRQREIRWLWRALETTRRTVAIIDAAYRAATDEGDRFRLATRSAAPLRIALATHIDICERLGVFEPDDKGKRAGIPSEIVFVQSANGTYVPESENG